ncbi:MAG: peptidoglycan bridge formation glycyltransferase FemA/FemB family protein [Chloroflexi bacterium]|nr:peptidoglycan bridge formation glycyltransferase FemA/FemB family protein [Chloroflexota bacterium]
MFNCKTIHSRDDWNRTLVSLPGSHVLQSWEWGEFKSRWGWEAQRLLWVNKTLDTTPLPVAAAQILHRRIPRTLWSFLYVSKGPLLNYADSTLAAQVLADLETYARQIHALFIKIDPDVPRAFGEPQPDQPFEPAGQALLDLLTQRGWCFSPEQIQFRNTIIINLTPSPEALLEAMKSKWRYNIRLAERKGVTIRSGSSEDIPLFYQSCWPRSGMKSLPG